MPAEEGQHFGLPYRWMTLSVLFSVATYGFYGCEHKVKLCPCDSLYDE